MPACYNKKEVKGMQFCEKLDFLMNITKTTNSSLSFNIRLDASYISRLRRGRRQASHNKIYIQAMSEYFARRCANDYQIKALIDIMNINPQIFEESNPAELIFTWLLDEHTQEANSVQHFLDGFSNIKVKQEMPKTETLSTPIRPPQATMSIYYGIEGKRQAVIYFLSQVLAQNKPGTLLLFSDEATDWMTTDPQFTARWALLMTQVLAKGNKIKIIHTVSRDLDEMLNAINQWMPLYMTGAIEPYFYPKKRDGVFKRTLFIAPGAAAIVSGYVGDMSDKAGNLLFLDNKAIASFAEEFNQYWRLCKPLMRIFTPKDKKLYFNTLEEFEKENSDSIIKTESLSLLTMPETVINSIIGRIEYKDIKDNKTNFIDYHKNRVHIFEKNLQLNHFTEIIRLPDIKILINAKVKVAFSDILSGGAAYYTLQEYRLHLENIVRLLHTYKNFHVYLTKEVMEDRNMVYAREDIGTIVAKTSAPPVALAINESNMTAAFWDFFKNIIGDKTYDNANNEDTAKKLTSYIQKLKTKGA